MLARLNGRVIDPMDLTTHECTRMYEIATNYWANRTWDAFEESVYSADWIVLVHNAQTNAVEGFMNLLKFQLVVDGQPVTIFFSGLTVVEKAYRQSNVLHQAGAQHIMRWSALCTTPVYWAFASLSYHSYHAMPAFVDTFYPNYHTSPSSDMQHVIDTVGSYVAKSVYHSRYDNKRGVITPADPQAPVALKSQFADIPVHRLHDLHISFFFRANPGHIRGEMLLCVASLAQSNLTKIGLRMSGLRAPGQLDVITC
jgi:hypothetical protein